MNATEFAFSTLLREPNRVTAQLANDNVVLHRRDGEDLYLSVRSRAEREIDGAAQTARMLGALVRAPGGQQLIADAVGEAFPWMRFLSEEGRSEFVSTFVDTARACADVGTWTALGQLLHEWKNTATIQADPELYAALSSPLSGDDYGPVPPPDQNAGR